MDKDLQSLDPSGRDFKVDIVCKTLGDRYFLIEMQNDYMSDYADKAYIEFARFLANIDRAKIYDLSMEKRKKLRVGSTEVDAKEFWKKIDEICTLVLSNKRFPADAKKEFYSDEPLLEPSVVNRYEMRNVENTNRHLGSIDANVILVMLANFNKTADELTSDFDRWMYALKDERMSSGKTKIEPFKSVSDIKKTARDSEALRQFYTQLHTRNIGNDVLIDYEKQIQEQMNA